METVGAVSRWETRWSFQRLYDGSEHHFDDDYGNICLGRQKLQPTQSTRGSSFSEGGLPLMSTLSAPCRQWQVACWGGSSMQSVNLHSAGRLFSLLTS